VPLGWGLAVVGTGVALLLALELEKALLRLARSRSWRAA
jgi:hypothetical protein